MYYIAIDIGGTTYSFGIFKQDKLIYSSDIFSITKFINGNEFLVGLTQRINGAIVSIEGNLKQVKGIGIACPGPLDSKNGKVLNTPNLKILANQDIVSKLVELTNVKNIKLEKDTNVFSLGESSLYYPKSKVLLVVTLGTGVGFGISINGKLFTGSEGFAGEYGRSPIITGGNWETILGKDFFKEISQEKYGEIKTAKEISHLFTQNDKNAIDIWSSYGYHLGLCLSHICNVLNPDTIVIGGGISLAFNYFEVDLLKSLQQNCHIYPNSNVKIISRIDWIKSIYYGCLNLTKNKMYLLDR